MATVLVNEGELLAKAQHVFGICAARPGQRDLLAAVLGRRDALALNERCERTLVLSACTCSVSSSTVRAARGDSGPFSGLLAGADETAAQSTKPNSVNGFEGGRELSTGEWQRRERPLLGSHAPGAAFRCSLD